jgi:hypothetical protein
MVRVVDEGSHFDAPLDKVWKMIEAHSTEMTVIHPAVHNPKMEMAGETQAVVAFDTEANGHKFKVKMRITALPPLGQILEILEGPLAGSKVINYYTPKGDKTGITVVADFASPMLPEAQLVAAGHEFLNGGFEDDSAYLRKMH